MAEILAGRLGPVRVGSLLQLAEIENLDACLRVGDQGEIWLRQGLPVAARAGRTQGLDALFDLFLVDQGPFRIEEAQPDEHLRPLGNIANLIIEGTRIADEWARVAPMVLRVQPGAVLHPTLARLADGVLPLWAACARAGESPAAVVDLVVDALREGRVEPVGAGVPQARGGDLAARFEACMDEGRLALKNRDFDQAERCFQQACALDPDSGVARQNLRRVQQLRRLAEGA